KLEEAKTMSATLSLVVGIIVLGCVFILFWEYRIRHPDVLVLYESKGQIGIRKGFMYPRHFSLPLKRTTYPIQLNIEAIAEGALGIRIKLVGSIAPSVKHIERLIR